jgi:phosphatidylglycerol:prolipoprotein diacylglycerol transferase
MLPVLQLGGLAIPLPPLVLLLGLWIALDVAQRQAARRGLDGDKAYNLAFNSLIIGLLAARLAYVLLNLDAYLAIRPGSEIPLVGLVVGLSVATFYIRRHNFDWKHAVDAYAVGAAVFVIALWLSHLFGGDAYGTETRLPWSVNLWGARRHPTQVYNLIASAVILAVIWRFAPVPKPGKKKKTKAFHGKKKRTWTALYDGFVAQLFVILTSATILLLEPLRGDSPVLAGGYRTWQIGALVALVASLALFARQAPSQPERRSAPS